MKRVLLFALAGSLALALAACGGGGEKSNGAPPVYGVHHVEDIVEAGAFSEELEELDGDTAFMLYKLADYGLEREDLTDCSVLRSAGATCEEGAVLILADSDKAQAAQDALKDYIDSQIEANRDYRPEEIPKLEGARIDRRGETLLLVVAGDMEAVPAFGG